MEHGIETKQVNGTCIHDDQWHHIWMVTDDGIVIDITGDQFIGKMVTEEEVDKVHVGVEGAVHKIFCINRHQESVTNFTDPNEYTDFGGRPSAYQQRLIDVYEILNLYL